VENDWTQCDLASKWSLAQTNLEAASADASIMYTTYLSANRSPSGADPADMAGGYGGGTGVVLMDFPGYSLINAIIGLNPGV